MFTTIDRDELRRILTQGNGVVLIVTLPGPAYRGSHRPRAINIRSDDIRTVAPRLIRDKTIPVVVYCASGPCRRSRRAADRLADRGYRDVRDYNEGKKDWIVARFSRSKAPAPEVPLPAALAVRSAPRRVSAPPSAD